MNNTHIIVINEDNDPIAIIKKGNTEQMLESFKVAVSEETGEGVEEVITKCFDKGFGFYGEIEVVFNDSVYNYNTIPTWLY